MTDIVNEYSGGGEKMGEGLESHKIMSMEEDKRERVINAAMKEFAKGYKAACTDSIVREAGISKGLLFHYFGTKDGLYSFILKNACEMVYNEYLSLINLEQSDIIEKIWQMTLLKVDLSYKHPALFDFLAKAYIDLQENPNEEFAAYFEKTRSVAIEKALADVDTSLFKDGIDAKKAANIVIWTLNGYSASKIRSDMTMEDYQNEYERYLEEIKEYISILRKTLYK
ncbi:MAG: TetR/AcrR family transcriptional regulator [Oscillospiraceae bacterium]|nr:TetR/AcrR family transcriptional regulator [Oscillospiraceae bacterium]